MHHPCIRAVALAGVALGALASPQVHAQQQTAQRVAIEEIVVTARKVEERLQDVPLAITAFTAADLERRNINELEDVARFTAGLVVEDGGSGFFVVPTLRGLTVVNVTGQVQNVPTFVDGIYLQRNYAIDFGAADIARVEVVKGPQSALYGQNAFAGAINYVLGKPTEKTEGKVSATVGNHGRFDFNGYLSTPIIQDKLGVRFGFARTKFDGTWKNNYPGIRGDFEKLGGKKTENFSASVRITPVERLEIELQYLHGNREEELTGGFSFASSDPSVRLNCGPIIATTGSPRYFCGRLSLDTARYQSATSRRLPGILFTDQDPSTFEMDFYKARVGYEIVDDLTINYLYGSIKAWGIDRSTTGVDPLNPPLIPFGLTIQGQKNAGKNDFRSHELRIDWTPQDLPFTARIGGYDARIKDQFTFNTLRVPVGQRFNDPTGDKPLATAGWAGTISSSRQLDKTQAAFGQVSYRFLEDRAKLTAEARYQEDKREFVDLVARFTQNGKFTNFTPRFTAEYKWTDENLLYASAAKGTKAGGFNGLVRSVTIVPGQPIIVPLRADEQIFDDEGNWTYELGSKNTFFDGRLVANLSAFYVDWSALQIFGIPANTPPLPPSVAPQVITQNLGNARSIGIELDGAFAATENLSFNYAFGFADPKYKNGTKSRRFASPLFCDNIVCPVDGEVGGKQLQRTSKITASLGAQWAAPITDDFGYYARADVSYRSKQFVDEMNLTSIAPVTLVNAAIGLTGQNWELQLWAKNLFDKKYIGSSFFIIQFGSYSPFFGDRRQIGLTGTVRF
jgi:iron complex outermembrane receptor protein